MGTMQRGPNGGSDAATVLFGGTRRRVLGWLPGHADQALARFAAAYADQNEKDHAALAKAIRKGTVKAVFEEG